MNVMSGYANVSNGRNGVVSGLAAFGAIALPGIWHSTPERSLEAMGSVCEPHAH
jgi:hypothetical protein